MALAQQDFEVLKTDKIDYRSNQPEQHKPFIRKKSHSGLEHVHYSLLYEGFPDEFQDQAEKELKETTENRKKGLQRLKEYMKSQDMKPLKDDLLLLSTLRNCKYNLKKAETKLKKLLTVRQQIAVHFRDLGMEKVEWMVDDMACGFLPYRDKCGRAILYTRPYGMDVNRITIADVALLSTAAALFLLTFPITSVTGYAYFAECKSPSLSLYYPLYKEFRKAMHIILSLPIRVSRVEVLNENPICRWCYNILKTMVSKKLVSRVTLHGSDLEKIRAMYNANLLPEDFGGNAGPISNQLYKQKFLDFMRDLINEHC